MTLIETVLGAEPIVYMDWSRPLLLRSLGLDAQVRTASPFDSPVADRYEAGDLDGTESPELYGMASPKGYRLLASGPSEDGEWIWAIYVRPITRLGKRFLEEISEADYREVAA
ncbi:hypothetical protein [Billgrantia ethanolica]|uniref:Gamma-glutamylcyclotransferase AIG2-like domain-containing protein n=1 Tax=Billgrantia ethanolica TaxID=2733486 RepID=A0ABS9ABA7_9GAMM|nr:hypothetical protein [Halomonas ethanolica]MCE8005325.1 hypothetical protein [Halomonas ethanolica]